MVESGEGSSKDGASESTTAWSDQQLRFRLVCALEGLTIGAHVISALTFILLSLCKRTNCTF